MRNFFKTQKKEIETMTPIRGENLSFLKLIRIFSLFLRFIHLRAAQAVAEAA
jgi:hypothetical protein